MRIFRAASGYFDYRRAQWLIKQCGTLISLLLGLALLTGASVFELGKFTELYSRWTADTNWFGLIELLAVAGFLLQLIPSYLLMVLDYEYRWYMMTDRSLRIREGIWKVQERTMTFSNIQNVSVRQGPLQRLLGIADLEVRSAGGGGTQGQDGQNSEKRDLHVAYFHGVDNAEEIREVIMERLKQLRAAGLGDPEDRGREPQQPPGDADTTEAHEVLLAARRLLNEVRGLSAHSSWGGRTSGPPPSSPASA